MQNFPITIFTTCTYIKLDISNKQRRKKDNQPEAPDDKQTFYVKKINKNMNIIIFHKSRNS